MPSTPSSATARSQAPEMWHNALEIVAEVYERNPARLEAESETLGVGEEPLNLLLKAEGIKPHEGLRLLLQQDPRLSEKHLKSGLTLGKELQYRIAVAFLRMFLDEE